MGCKLIFMNKNSQNQDDPAAGSRAPLRPNRSLQVHDSTLVHDERSEHAYLYCFDAAVLLAPPRLDAWRVA